MSATVKVFQDGVNAYDAADANGMKLENNNSITNTGQSLDTGNNNQTSNAMAVYASKGDFYKEAALSAADVYILENTGLQRQVFAIQDGMRMRFKVTNANTGASTVNINALGAKAIEYSQAALLAGMLTVGDVVTIVYELSVDKFNLIYSLKNNSLFVNPANGRVGIGTTITNAMLKLVTNESIPVIFANATLAGFQSAVVLADTSRAANSLFGFFEGRTLDGGDREFHLRGDGNGLCDGAWTGGGADVAEYNESKTGNQIDLGVTTVYENGLVRECQDGEIPFGAIRPKDGGCSLVMNNKWNHWKGKYLKTPFGNYKKEIVEYVKWPESGIKALLKRNKKDIVYRVSELGNVIPPENSEYFELEEKILNPEYDPTLEFIPYEKRDEKVLVGILGQIPILKGQIVSPSWVLLKEIDNNTDLYYVGLK